MYGVAPGSRVFFQAPRGSLQVDFVLRSRVDCGPGPLLRTFTIQIDQSKRVSGWRTALYPGPYVGTYLFNVTPSPSPTPTCSDPNHDARIIRFVYPVRYFDYSWRQVTVKVYPDEHGHVLHAFVSQTTGFTWDDRASGIAAEATTYEPKVINCIPAPSVTLWGMGIEH